MFDHSNNCAATQRQKRQTLKDHIDAPEEDYIDSTKRQKLKDGDKDLKDQRSARSSRPVAPTFSPANED
jgi:hypothetical protein